MLTFLSIRFPDRVPKEDHDKILKDRFFYGIKTDLRNSICVTQLRSGEDPELRNTLKNASYQGGRAAKCFKYSPTKGDGGVWAIRSSPG